MRNVPEAVIPHVVHHLARVSRILELSVQQWGVVETLTPQDFLSFRDKLAPASGFQSFQMRELELVLGRTREERLHYGGVDPVEHIRHVAKGSLAGEMALERLARAEAETSLRDVLQDCLYRTPIQGSRPRDEGDEEVVQEFLDEYLRSHAAQQERQLQGLVANGIADEETLRARFEAADDAARGFLLAETEPVADRARLRRARAGLLFIESYRMLPLLSWPRLLVDSIVEVEEQFVLWRNRHARMTERTIGRRVGTGGSTGVEHLDKAAEGRIFPELWAIRSLLLPVGALPELRNPDYYGFKV